MRRSERFKPAADLTYRALQKIITLNTQRYSCQRFNATANSSAIHDRSTNGGLDSIEIVRGHVLLCRCLSAYRYFISRR
ncbi:hypothetical protein ALC57_17646 [Trachymyrmex cornetzi]|uniref:Uncharacterized protein n=1 Tax=Trachymyrmex cornetzi TaxID=471704 RepID=A0A151ITK2_9HYME|nr:hypothetical protein ALC57_17646 [Trachymyrmex cornetzi]